MSLPSLRQQSRQRSASSLLTASELRAELTYDPDQGVFWWLKAHGTAKSGRIAGSINGDGYRTIKVLGRQYQAHRLAWLYVTGEWPEGEIDHADGLRWNNSWANLRVATRSQNGANKPARQGTLAGIKGVSFDKRRQRWVAQIQKDGRCHFLGSFDNASEAAKAYFRAASELHGEFARTA